MLGDDRDVRTLLLAGAGLVLAGVLELLLSLGPGIAVTEEVTIPYSALGLPLVAQLVLLAATVLLAIRTRRLGIAATGWIGLVVFGAQGVLDLVTGVLPLGLPLGVRLVIGTSIQVLPVVGLVVATALIARGGAAERLSTWALVPLAAVELIALVLEFIPSVAVVPALLLLGGTVAPLLMAAAGAALLIESRATRAVADVEAETAAAL